jgi:hypothetical protein
MTELDFIPQWYRNARNRKLWHQRQYIMIAFAVFAIACGLMAAGRSLALAQAKLTLLRSEFESGISSVQRFKELQSELNGLQKDAKLLEAVSPRTPYTAVLGELSHCVGSNIVLSKLRFQTAPIEATEKNSFSRQKTNRVQLGSASAADSSSLSPVQTELILCGVAANGSAVAELIASLEQSSYFRRVVPGFSRNVKVLDSDVAEFEIRCVLADFEIIR